MGFGGREDGRDAEHGQEQGGEATGEQRRVDELWGVLLDADDEHDAGEGEEEHQTDQAHFEGCQVLERVLHGSRHEKI